MPITYRTSAYGGANAPLTNAQIDENFSWLNTNKAATTHTHAASDIISGTMATARLGSGTASSTTWLRGDSTWQTIQSGSAIANDTATTTALYPIFAAVTTGTPANVYVSSTKLTFTPSTGVLGATNFNSLSDANFKTDLERITGALDKIKLLTGYDYTLKETGQRSSGLLSQDVEKVQPSLVTEVDGIKTLAYGNMMGLVVEAIKEIDDKLSQIQKQLENK